MYGSSLLDIFTIVIIIYSWCWGLSYESHLWNFAHGLWGHAGMCVDTFMPVGMCMCTCVCLCVYAHMCICVFRSKSECLSGVCSGLPFSWVRLSFVFFITLCTTGKLVHKLPGKSTVPASYLTMGALGFHMYVTSSEFLHWFQSFNFSYQTCISSIFANHTSPPASMIHIYFSNFILSDINVDILSLLWLFLIKQFLPIFVLKHLSIFELKLILLGSCYNSVG